MRLTEVFVSAEGWIKLWRKSRDSGLLQNPELWTFWCWCLLKATHKPYKQMVGYQTINLKPGQFIFGRKQAAKELKTTERKIRTCIEKLTNMQNLTIKTTNKFSVITIVNWDAYQGDKNENDQVNDQQATNKRPTSDHKQEYKEYKECKNKKKTSFVEDSPELRLSRLLFGLIQKRNPNHKSPNLQTWAKQIDLMVRIDKRKPDEIERVIKWTQQNEFWQNNILSTTKLRKQYDQLVLKMPTLHERSTGSKLLDDYYAKQPNTNR